MMQSVATRSARATCGRAGKEIGDALRNAWGDEHPDAIVVFASGRQDHHALLQSLADRLRSGRCG